MDNPVPLLCKAFIFVFLVNALTANPLSESTDTGISGNQPFSETDKSLSDPFMVTDEDGNTYPVIEIGAQGWMAENLRTATFRNGSKIPDSDSGVYLQNDFYYSAYNNDPSFGENYGNLYTWKVVQDPQGICPSGWRMPDESDWQQLIEFLDPDAWGNKNIAGSLLKSCRQLGSPLGGDCSTGEHPRWDSHSRRFGTDEYGFAVLPAGLGYKGNFENLGTYAYFWTSSSSVENYARAVILLNSHTGVSRSNYHKDFAFSVRCIRADEGTEPTVKTTEVIAIAASQVTGTGSVTHDGGSTVTERGIIWGTDPELNMDTYEGITSEPGGTGTYSSSISELAPETTYYFRAWAVNEKGSALGNQINYTTPPEPALPTVKTSNDINLLPFKGEGTGEVIHDGHLEITARGLVYSKYPEVDLSQKLGVTYELGGKGEFISTMGPLWPETTYYIRAYATNALGTAYGEEITVQTPDFDNCGIIHDIEGNPYKTVIIGQKCFMRENLRSGKFRNGDIIPNVQDDSDWKNTNQPAWVNYNNNPDFDEIYGKLYNWYVVNDSRGICPQGWRVTSRLDMFIVSELLGGGHEAGGKIKQSLHPGQFEEALWLTPNTDATNESGFTAVPHGYRLGNGYFGGLGTSAYWRTSTSANNQSYQYYTYFDTGTLSLDMFGHHDGDAVRCIREE
jgi:uncharacterized protein (TIGR02145 family)